VSSIGKAVSGRSSRMAAGSVPRRGEDGVAVVEFAIVAGLFIVLLWGILSYGAIFATKQAMAHAASEAALVAVTEYPDGDLDTAARAVIASQLAWLTHFGFDAHDGSMVAISEVTCEGSEGVPCIRVQLTHSWRGQGAVIPPIAKVATPASLTEYAVVKAWE
jgi:hypothetical protein